MIEDELELAPEQKVLFRTGNEILNLLSCGQIKCNTAAIFSSLISELGKELDGRGGSFQKVVQDLKNLKIF
ncbi:MAG: hypothetical protein HUK21_06725 [Fibrobacteraceae bacterium]|nr:hypothetical protein [Fibrobacteraceae bacterium]